MDRCEHAWVPGKLTTGQPIERCSKCPRWRMKWVPPTPRKRDPENTRRSMEETSRYLGEHRDN